MQIKLAVLKLDHCEGGSARNLASLRHNKNAKEILHNPHEVREELFSKKRLIKLDHLPEIASPYLKKTVNDLFPNGSCQLSPIHLQKSNHFEKYSQSIFDQKIKIGIRANKIFNSAEFCHETSQNERFQNPIGKCPSQVKADSKLNFQYFSSPTVKSSKVTTQQSNSSVTSKQICQRSTYLKRFSSTKEPAKSPEGRNVQEFRQSSFVLKHKLAHSLYSQEKSELKLIQSILASRQGNSMGKSLKVKNYTKFVPNIINIQT